MTWHRLKQNQTYYRKYCRTSEQWCTSKQQQNAQNRRGNNQDKDQKQEDPNHLQAAVLKVQVPKALAKRKWLTRKTTR
jgi:hypothetical protein